MFLFVLPCSAALRLRGVPGCWTRPHDAGTWL
jgi:hypothetical protein